jgi:hypothetical protein
MILRVLCLLIVGLLASGGRAEADCSGSGQTWTCTAGTTPAQVNSTLASATANATLTFDAGAYTWNAAMKFDPTKGATLICASVGGCTVTVSGTILGMNGNCTGTRTDLFRISGFVFNGGNTVIWFNAFDINPTGCTLTQIRIDNNTFNTQGASQRIIFFGDNSNDSYFYGVMDNNTVNNSTGVHLVEFVSNTGSAAPATTRGTVTNMFIEDGNFQLTANTGLIPCMDSTGSPSVVWRMSVHRNCRMATHGTTHGGGMVNWEVYGNDHTCDSSGWTDCYRAVHHQGSGESIAFDNIFRPSGTLSGAAMDWLFYRSADPVEAGYSAALGRCDGDQAGDGNRAPTDPNYGYNCKRQPGRDVNGVLQPMYFWNNRTGAGVRVPMGCSWAWTSTPPQTCVNHLIAERDYFQAGSALAQTSPTSPFNGTTGVGFGTLANRPVTCSVGGTQAADAGNGGVGYWATDVGAWNRELATASGRLYRCSATNTWTLHYTPFTFPHPLRGNLGGTPDSPTNVRVGS